MVNAGLAVLIGIMVWGATAMFNDFYDLSIDRSTNPGRPLVTGEVSGMEVVLLGTLMYFLSTVLALLHGDLVFTIVVFAALILGFQYSAPPLRLRRHGITGALTIGAGISLAFLAGITSLGSVTLEGTMIALLFGLLAFTASSLKDFKDVQGDEKAGVKTLPVILGAAPAMRVIMLGMAASYLLLLTPYFLGFFSWATAPLVLGVGAVNLLLVKNIDKSYVYTKVCGFLVVLLFILAKIAS